MILQQFFLAYSEHPAVKLDLFSGRETHILCNKIGLYRSSAS
jgi:hypothetical protein